MRKKREKKIFWNSVKHFFPSATSSLFFWKILSLFAKEIWKALEQKGQRWHLRFCWKKNFTWILFLNQKKWKKFLFKKKSIFWVDISVSFPRYQIIYLDFMRIDKVSKIYIFRKESRYFFFKFISYIKFRKNFCFSQKRKLALRFIFSHLKI